MDIAREGQKLLAFYHFHGFFADGGGGFFEVKLLLHGHKENVVRARFAHGDEGFENSCGVFAQCARNVCARDSARVGIVMLLKCYFHACELSHSVGFFSHFLPPLF